MESVARKAARLIVVDPEKSVLLFEYEDHRGRWWATPGGGLEPHERFEEAAAREAREELGLFANTGNALWESVVEYESRGRWIRQTERFFLIRTTRADAVFNREVDEAHRLEGILSSRWWSIDDLARSEQHVFPTDLLDRIRGVFSELEALPNQALQADDHLGRCAPSVARR